MLDEDTRRTDFSRFSAEQRRQFLRSTLDLTAAPEGHSVLRNDFSRPLWILFVATAVLLALTCLNVAGLFLARGSARHREISTKLALGASRGRIGRQLLADSVLLAFAGGLLGVAMAPIADTGAHRIPAAQHRCDRLASQHRCAFVAFCVSCKPGHRLPRRALHRLCRPAANRWIPRSGSGVAHLPAACRCAGRL